MLLELFERLNNKHNMITISVCKIGLNDAEFVLTIWVNSEDSVSKACKSETETDGQGPQGNIIIKNQLAIKMHLKSWVLTIALAFLDISVAIN